MKRLYSMTLLTLAVSALLLVLFPGAGIAEEGSSAAHEYEWRSCARDGIQFVVPKGWHLASEQVSDGVARCTLTAGTAEKGALRDGRITFQHWFQWPATVGVQPSEYAVTSMQKLAMMGRVVDQHSGARGASLAHRIELVTSSGDQEIHKWVLFVAHSEHGTLDMVTAEWPEGAWEEAWEIARPALESLRFADQE